MRAAFAASPPPMVKARRLKLFYAAQAAGTQDRSAKGRIRRSEHLQPPEFVLFVNDPRLLSQSYARYLKARIRDAQPYVGLPIILTLRPRTETRRK
jgi:GTP-binding protein